jgi:hypothetical protein
MNSKKKLPKPTKKDKEWEKKMEERLKAEKIELDHPKGRERFKTAIKNIQKKND